VSLSELAAQALGALSRKERTVAEMRAWLAERAESEEKAEAALAELIAAEAVDDERFARRYAEDKREISGWGDERIAETLGERGVERELIDQAIGGDEEGELDRAVALLRRRGEAPADERARARCFGALARKGYSAELAYEAVRRYSRESAERAA
jgi:regulatory protein